MSIDARSATPPPASEQPSGSPSISRASESAVPALPAADRQPDGTLDAPPLDALWRPDPQAVHRFGDYILLDKIAEGGMGVVYRARQVSLNRVVAIKMIANGVLATRNDLARFHAEAEAAAGLDHPHIVTVYEVGEHQGQPYFSMKYVHGGSLSTLLRAGGPLAARPAAELMATLAAAVHHAHQHHVVHRDLKPGNILLARVSGVRAEGDRLGPNASSMTLSFSVGEMMPFVADFGLAKRLGADHGATRSGAIIGTPSYMSPEQARGSKDLTTATDVYSLGAILYECLTGRPPFRGTDPFDTVRQVIECEPADPRDFNPVADRELCVITLKCLEKEPARRYQGADALAADLTNWLSGRPIAAKPAGRTKRLGQWVKRNPALVGLSVAQLMLTTGLMLLVGVALYRERHKEVDVAQESGRTSDDTPGRPGGQPPKESLIPRRRQTVSGVGRTAGEQIDLEIKDDLKVAFVWCPPGTFQMGGSWSDDEKPVHEVVIRRGFFMGKYEVTQDEWQAVMGANPSKHKYNGGRRPVEQVSWYHAQEYCEKLGDVTGQRVRLPTEAEWEYACRAGTAHEYYWGDVPSAKRMNYDFLRVWNGSEAGVPLWEPTDVGTFPGNPWSLHDMHGNVSEWCQDYGDREYYRRARKEDPVNTDISQGRVVRGGTFWLGPERSRSASRVLSPANMTEKDVGLRVCFNPE